MSAVKLLTEHLALWSSADTEKKSGRGRASGSAASVYGMKKLRELILELAVRGKLVPQVASDEPASELLKLIATEKAKLVADGKIRKGKPFSHISAEEMIFDLPLGWEWVRLGGIGDWGAGATPSRSVSSYYGGAIPWFKSGELATDFIDTAEETVTELALKDCSLRLNQPDDVLIAMYGATIGKTSILSVQGTTNQAVCACTPYTGIFNRYLHTLLKAMRPNFIGQGAGGAQPNISREKIIATSFALPPTLEQHRIVAKVDELMALCDQLENQHTDAIAAHEKLVSYLLCTLIQSQNAADFNGNWQRIAANFEMLFSTESTIDALKQTLLQLAVMGKLVQQDENDEPAVELLKRMQVEKLRLVAEGKIKKSKPLAEVRDDESLFDVPNGWAWVRLGFIVESFSNGLYKPEKFYTDNGVISLRMFNINDGNITLEGVRRIEVDSDEMEKYALSAGDLLINRVNSKELVGKTALISEYHEPMVYESMNMRARPFKGFVNSAYLNLYMKSNIVKNAIFSFSKEAIGQASINQTQISMLITPLPPLTEQSRIVTKVDELITHCDTLKSRITAANRLQQKIADVLVGEAV